MIVAAVTVAVLGLAGAARWAGRRREALRPASPVAIPRLSVNVARPSQIAQIPGVGVNLARAIVRDRRENGPFRSEADLDRVRGIGPVKAALVAGYVGFGDESDDAGESPR